VIQPGFSKPFPSQSFASCQTNTEVKFRRRINDALREPSNVSRVKLNRTKVILPIGRTAQVAFQIEAMRAECCAAAHLLANEMSLNEDELEECARLDDALAQAQRLLKATVANVMIARLRRRSRVG
jgi:hypothetical protein